MAKKEKNGIWVRCDDNVYWPDTTYWGRVEPVWYVICLHLVVKIVDLYLSVHCIPRYLKMFKQSDKNYVYNNNNNRKIKRGCDQQRWKGKTAAKKGKRKHHSHTFTLKMILFINTVVYLKLCCRREKKSQPHVKS